MYDDRERLRIRKVALVDQFAQEKKNNRGSDLAKQLRAEIEQIDQQLSALSNARVEPSTINVQPDLGL